MRVRDHLIWRVRWGEYLGLEECPYAQRWSLELPLGSIRVHHFFKSDDVRYLHDHPWWFITLILKGGYVDQTPEGNELLKPGRIYYRPAHHRHAVIPVRPEPEGSWSLILTGRPRRFWGFWVKGRFKRSHRFFFDIGHPPCEDIDTK